MLPETIKYQNALASYCRTGHLDIRLPGITPNRLEQYHRLVNGVVFDALDRAYPITRKLLTEKEWNDFINTFFSKHDCKTPQIWKMPFELYQFAVKHNYNQALGKPYLTDLLLFEWTEIEIHCSVDIQRPSCNKEGFIEKDLMVFNPEYKILQFQYPVHLSSDPNILNKKAIYYLLVFRDYKYRNVHFINLGIFPAIFLMHLLDDTPLLEDAIIKTAKQLNVQISIKERLILINFLKDLKKQKFLLGFLN